MCCLRPPSSKAGSTVPARIQASAAGPTGWAWPSSISFAAVGRAKLRAYAYLTYGTDVQLSEVAEKRLKVLGDLDSLGAGFQLASHDLDIRGAGNLLGDEQSGHIREVGFELYQSMLEDAILAAKAGATGSIGRETALTPVINAPS